MSDQKAYPQGYPPYEMKDWQIGVLPPANGTHAILFIAKSQAANLAHPMAMRPQFLSVESAKRLIADLGHQLKLIEGLEKQKDSGSSSH